MKVWVTRAEPGAGETAQRLTELGHEPLIAPLLRVRRLADAAPDLTDVSVLAFTSANGVRAFAQASSRRDLPVFAVGEATAAAARLAGFEDVHAGASDVAGLAADLVRWRDAAAAPDGGLLGQVLHAGAAEPAGDLAGALRAAGVFVRTLALYHTIAADPPSPSLLQTLSGAEAVLLHSPKAARQLADVIRAGAAPLDLGGVHLLGLSPACLAPLDDLPAASRRSARAPNDADLLALLDVLEPDPQRPRPIFTPLVWTLLMLSALCILAGAAIGFSRPGPHDRRPAQASPPATAPH